MSDKLDMTAVNELKELMGPAFPALVERYKVQSTKYIQSITTGIAESDAEKVAQAAHPLKSSSKQLGASDLYELAKTIELEAKEHGAITDTLNAAFEPLEDEFKLACDALSGLALD